MSTLLFHMLDSKREPSAASGSCRGIPPLFTSSIPVHPGSPRENGRILAVYDILQRFDIGEGEKNRH